MTGVQRPLSTEDRFVQPGLFGLPPKDIAQTGYTYRDAKHCLSELGSLVSRRLQLNMADAGQHIDHPRRGEQQQLAEHGPEGNFEEFKKARQTAANTYKKLGNQAMCEQCLGADGCPFRAVNPNTGDRAVNSPKKFEQYTGALPQSARDNIKRAKVTPTTVAHSTKALKRL